MRREKIMKKQTLNKFMATGIAMTMTGVLLAGCSNSTVESEVPETVTEAIEETEEVAKAGDVADATQLEAPYFTKGVYVNYITEAENPPLTYFYVFTDETTGYTDDAESGTGLPFNCEQKDGTVTFYMGGAEENIEEVLTVDSVEGGKILGHLDDGINLTFVLEENADPDNFYAKNYINEAAGEDLIYNDANGWSVRYDPSVITVNQGGPVTTFVYTGESAGTNMITATYSVDSDAKTAIEELAKSFGENATTTESVFPGTADVTSYYAILPPSEDGSGLYETAIARDYMDGYLLFELTGHNSGDDAIDIPVSDALAAIIDSIQFAEY